MERIGQLGDGGKWVCGLSKYIEFSEMAEAGEAGEAAATPTTSSSTKGLSKKTGDEEDGDGGEDEGNEGGKHGNNLVVYSFGVRDDSSFEEVMLEETNAEVVAVDFSVGSVCSSLSSNHSPFFPIPSTPNTAAAR